MSKILTFGSTSENVNLKVNGSITTNNSIGESFVVGNQAAFNHNIPRVVNKDITSYYNDGTLYDRLNGTNGFSLFEDIYTGDYFKMSRPISAKNPDSNYQLTGSDYVTIASIDGLMGNGDIEDTKVNYHHLIMIPGKGIGGGSYHFGRSRMNPTNSTEGAYIGSEMNKTVIGPVTTTGSISESATINEQLYAEFGSHLKTTREVVANSINPAGYNRYGTNSGCSNNWAWYSMQAILMSEIELYGSIVWSSSGCDTGTANRQLDIMKYGNKLAINNRAAWYFLKDVANSSYFCISSGRGHTGYSYASDAGCYVRPRFVIAA